MHENTQYFLIFPFFETFRGLFSPSGPLPRGAAPWSYVQIPTCIYEIQTLCQERVLGSSKSWCKKVKKYPFFHSWALYVHNMNSVINSSKTRMEDMIFAIFFSFLIGYLCHVLCFFFSESCAPKFQWNVRSRETINVGLYYLFRVLKRNPSLGLPTPTLYC